MESDNNNPDYVTDESSRILDALAQLMNEVKGRLQRNACDSYGVRKLWSLFERLKAKSYVPQSIIWRLSIAISALEKRNGELQKKRARNSSAEDILMGFMQNRTKLAIGRIESLN